MKTRIFNLIILDESGSMSCVKRQTIDGCNETINTIITAQNAAYRHPRPFCEHLCFSR